MRWKSKCTAPVFSYTGLECLKKCKVDIRQNNMKQRYFSITNPLWSGVQYALWKWTSLLSEKSVISEKFSKMSSVFLVFLWLQDGFQLQLDSETKKSRLAFFNKLSRIVFYLYINSYFRIQSKEPEKYYI